MINYYYLVIVLHNMLGFSRAWGLLVSAITKPLTGPQLLAKCPTRAHQREDIKRNSEGHLTL